MRLLDRFERVLRMADIRDSPGRYLFKLFLFSQVIVVFVLVFLAFLFLAQGEPLLPLLMLYLLFSLIIFSMMLMIPFLRINAKRTDIDFDLVYTVRHLLLRLESGLSLLNALEEVSELKTKSSKLFSTLIFDIRMGKTLKGAVEESLRYSVSQQYSKVLGNIKVSLDTGADLNTSLRNTLQELITIKKDTLRSYGKRLNPVTMLYMIFGTIFPSVGASVLIMAFSFISFIGESLARLILIVFAIVIVLIQISFYMIFNALRPKVF